MAAKETAPADAICCICGKTPHPEVTKMVCGRTLNGEEFTRVSYYCIGQKKEERACHEAVCASTPFFSSKVDPGVWSVHSLTIVEFAKRKPAPTRNAGQMALDAAEVG